MTAVSYGSVSFAHGQWLIVCEPHVRGRLKRVFPRVAQHAADRILLSATPENTRDLEWFLQRYPMAVSHADELRTRSAQHEDMERRLADMLAQRTPLPDFELALPPREYQREAAAMLAVRHGLLLGDDVGLGKTVSGICSMTQDVNLPALVVCQTNLPGQWAAEISKFAPNLRTHVIRSGKPYSLVRSGRSRQADLWDEPPDVLIINYHKLRGWAEELAGVVRYVVFDECQQLRSGDSQIYHAARHVARKARLTLGLSATPIYNYGSEFFWVVDALLPEALGTRDEFLREWCTPERNGKSSISDTERFGAFLRREGILLRRTRGDVGRELPRLTKIIQTVENDTDVLERISGDAAALARTILAHNERYRGEKMQAAGQFDLLVRQATGIAKAPYVADFVRMLAETGQRVLLFGWHREVYSIWMEKLAGLNPVLYTGSESPKQKEAAKQAFESGESRVLIMSLRSGAGLDGLQHCCTTVIFGELDWSPGVHEQCIGRAHRDGQQDPVFAYYLVSEEGSDPIVSDVLGVKREQIEGVRNPGIGMAERIEPADGHVRRLAEAYLTRQGGASGAFDTSAFAKREAQQTISTD